MEKSSPVEEAGRRKERVVYTLFTYLLVCWQQQEREFTSVCVEREIMKIK
jgi:hypothetical protein